jgi:putative transposase
LQHPRFLRDLTPIEAGRTTEVVAHEHGISKCTIDVWKAKYGNMEVSGAEEIKRLRDASARLKKLAAELSPDKDMLRSVIRQNSLDSRSGGEVLAGEFKTSERHFGELTEVPRSS